MLSSKKVHIMQEIVKEVVKGMEKKRQSEEAKEGSRINDEMQIVYQNEANVQSGQPVPQPKDYDEIEY
jgi:hypothetical protein